MEVRSHTIVIRSGHRSGSAFGQRRGNSVIEADDITVQGISVEIESGDIENRSVNAKDKGVQWFVLVEIDYSGPTINDRYDRQFDRWQDTIRTSEREGGVTGVHGAKKEFENTVIVGVSFGDRWTTDGENECAEILAAGTCRDELGSWEYVIVLIICSDLD